MFRRFIAAVIAALLFSWFFFGEPAKATDNGNTMLEGCTAFSEGGRLAQGVTLLQETECLGIIEGIADEATANHYDCFPNGVTAGQEAKVAVKYMNDHPADLNLPITVIISSALHTAWPCREQKNPSTP
jgi:hypothetical protein